MNVDVSALHTPLVADEEAINCCQLISVATPMESNTKT